MLAGHTGLIFYLAAGLVDEAIGPLRHLLLRQPVVVRTAALEVQPRQPHDASTGSEHGLLRSQEPLRSGAAAHWRPMVHHTVRGTYGTVEAVTRTAHVLRVPPGASCPTPPVLRASRRRPVLRASLYACLSLTRARTHVSHGWRHLRHDAAVLLCAHARRRGEDEAAARRVPVPVLQRPRDRRSVVVVTTGARAKEDVGPACAAAHLARVRMRARARVKD